MSVSSSTYGAASVRRTSRISCEARLNEEEPTLDTYLQDLRASSAASACSASRPEILRSPRCPAVEILKVPSCPATCDVLVGVSGVRVRVRPKILHRDVQP